MNQNVATLNERQSLLVSMASKYGVEPEKMLKTLKSTAFRGDVTNEQMMALLVVANQYNLNPWLKEIYAFPDQHNGIVPVVGVDGWSRIINEHDEFDGMDFEQDEESCTCIIYRKDRAHPIKVTEYMSECKRNTSPWKTHPRRMLRHKAMIQCARIAFGFVGMYDPDEADRIIDAPKAEQPRSTTLSEITAQESESVTIEGESAEGSEAGESDLTDDDIPY